LKHQQLVKIGIQHGARNGVQIPVMVVRAPGKVDNHSAFTLIEFAAHGGAGLLD
jgi:hypothetical protein